MSEEDEFQAQVIELAHRHGWLVAHFRPARIDKGWRTPVAADGKGFPDLIMVRGQRMIVIECKSKRGKPSEEQWRWLTAFDAVPCIEVLVSRPAPTMDALEALLA